MPDASPAPSFDTPSAEPPAAPSSGAPVTLAAFFGLSVTREEIVDQLRGVIDPELGIGIVDLGLVYDCAVADGVAWVLMTTTTPACPIGTYLSDEIRRTLFQFDGVLDVEIEVTYDPPWTPALMSEAAKAALGWGR